MNIVFKKSHVANILKCLVKILTVVLVLISYTLLSGCGNNKSDNYSKAENKKSAVTTAIDDNTVTSDIAKTGTQDLQSVDI